MPSFTKVSNGTQAQESFFVWMFRNKEWCSHVKASGIHFKLNSRPFSKNTRWCGGHSCKIFFQRSGWQGGCTPFTFCTEVWVKIVWTCVRIFLFLFMHRHMSSRRLSWCAPFNAGISILRTDSFICVEALIFFQDNHSTSKFYAGVLCLNFYFKFC